MSRRRRRLFVAISLALPCLLLAGAEGTLRLCGFGGYPRAIQRIGPVPGGTLVVTSVPGAASYFSRSQSKGGAITEQSFLTPKPPGTVRVLLVGESAIKGFPQPPALANSAFLKAMLGDVWSDRIVEVINLGTTAIASFPALEILTEALEYEPDLAVIYTGNNEFFGAYGVATTHSAGTSPRALRFQRWARALGITQAVERLVTPAQSGEKKTLMELVVAQGYIGPDDPLRQAAARNLNTHISEMIERCRRKGIPVIVCTLAANERDLAPIGKDDVAATSDAPRARAHYQRGEACHAAADYGQAAAEFQQALDLDTMPWRATSSINNAVRQAATEHGAVLCDIQAIFRQASPGGSIGWELMDDHVHPSLEGQALLARAIVETMTRLAGPLNVPRPAFEALPPFAAYADRLGDNLYERYGAAHTVRVLFDIPFMRESNPGAIGRFNELCQKYEAQMSPPVLEEVRAWQKPATHTGIQRPISSMAGTAMLKEKRFAEAEKLFRVAQECVPLYSSWNCEYVYRMLACRMALNGQLTEEERRLAAAAVQRGEYILTRSPEHPGLTHRWIGRLQQLCGQYPESIPHLLAARQTLWGMELVATDAALIDAYIKTGASDSARKLIDQGLQDSGEFAAYYRQFRVSLPESQPTGVATTMTAILGISAFYHDSAAALVVDGNIVAAAQEERFTRVKHDYGFPARALEYCLSAGNLSPARLDAVVFYDKPILKFERLLETYLACAPRGFRSFLMAMPLWLGQKLFLPRVIDLGLDNNYEGPLYFPAHHESHAASAFFPSPFEEAAIVTLDGVGEWSTTTWGVGRGNRVELRQDVRFPHSLGLLYSAFTYYTGFKVNSGEYKVMGLAPYGEPKYVDAIFRHIMDLKEDGSFWLDQSYFDYCAGLTMTSAKFHRLFGGPPRQPESPLTQKEMDLAASVQVVTEEVMLRIARHAHRQTGLKDLCLAGGVALNCVGNGRILRDGPFERIWIQPAAGDAGGALGAALFAWHQILGHPRTPQQPDGQQGSFLGPRFSDTEIRAYLDSVSAKYTLHADEDKLLQDVAELMAAGKVVGFFQGRMEFGPRALGARSILGDARNSRMQATMNLKIKFRESFRPFAPSCLEERVSDYFELDRPSPYMLLVAQVRRDRCRPMDAAQRSLFGIDKLNVLRSDIPAITHIDYSARVQTVARDVNPRYHRLLKAFEAATGYGVIVNTSFNIRGEPIVCTPEDAYRCFMFTEMDALVLENAVCLKTDQPPLPGAAEHKKRFKLD